MNPSTKQRTKQMTTSNTTYNGWTNYETWKMNLEVIDGNQDFWAECFNYYLEEGIDTDEAVLMLADAMKENTEEFAYEGLEDTSIAESAVTMYIQAVNWIEIAKHYKDL